MRIKNTFIQGKMNKDVDERLLVNGQYPHAENVRVSNSESSDIGAIQNVLGNRALTTLSLGANPSTIFQVKNNFSDTIYWGVKSDQGSYVIEHNTNTNTTTFVLRDERAGDANVLGFDRNFLVTDARILVDSDNNRTFLFLTDDNKFIKQINIERAKTYALNGFTEEDIALIKKPPLDPPTIQLNDTASDDENNIEEKFYVFAYRYRYLDGEYSALSPFSEVAFRPERFSYNFATSSNDSMVNDFNRVVIRFNTGSNLVTDIDIVYKEINNPTVRLVDTFNKAEKSWNDNSTQSINFTNDKTSLPLPARQLARLFDNVPRKAKSLELIGNRLVLGNYTENYNMVNSENNAIVPQISLANTQTDITNGTPTTTAKSNRDYEVGIAYGDSFGRLTTVFPSENNTTHVDFANSTKQNRLVATVSSRPPEFAEFYRFYIKQPRRDYDVIVPTLFYQDGAFVWIKIESADVDKVSAGDFLYVKSDTRGLVTGEVRTKILEITRQPRNFLDRTGSNDLLQLAGNYAKIRPEGFNLAEADLEQYVFRGYDDSDGDNNVIRNNPNVIQPPIYYGTVGLNDLTRSGTYTGTTDRNYTIEIDGLGDGSTTFNTFRWSTDDGMTYQAEDVVITAGTPQALNDGVQITFAANTGHMLNDRWIVRAKSSTDDGLGIDENSRAYAIFKGSSDTDVIRAGARITITYDEYNEETQFVQRSYVSSTGYANLEEWFYGDNIIATLGIPIDRIWFRRGVVGQQNNPFGQRLYNFIEISNDGTTGDMNMIIRSLGFENSGFDASPRVNSTLAITQSDTNVLFETNPTEIEDPVYYELPRTYPIVGGFHTSTTTGDTNQTSSQNAVITLPFYNAFAWGNGFESIKIRDVFNANRMDITTRPLASIEDYRENVRISSLTYSEPYNQTTNYNAINEFNLSLANFKDMDDSYGSIQKLWSRDTDLIVFQEDKTHKVLFGKSILYNADGSGNVSQSDDVLGQEIGYSGEYGISKNPESFAIYGNYIWHTDTRRGCVLQLTNNGYHEISANGMRDYFRDYFRNNLTARKFGMYDPYHDQYVLALKGSDQTVTYDAEVKGWTSFHSFIPDGMVELNNRFYTIKNGQLYVHNDETVARNTYYGTAYPSRLSLLVNQEPSTIKELHAISYEGSEPWSATLRSYITTLGDFKQSTLSIPNFVEKEGLWYSYARRNEQTNYESKAAYGIGVVTAINGNVVTVNGGSALLTNTDRIFTQALTEIGAVTAITASGSTTQITLSSVSGLTTGTYIFGMKNNRVEGGNLRGYSFRYDLENSTTNKAVELYAVNSEVKKSYTS